MTATLAWKDDVRPRYRWGPAAASCYEVWYGKLNYRHEGADCAFWFRYELLAAASVPEAHVWGIHFNASDAAENFPAHRRFALKPHRVSPDTLALEFDRDAELCWDAVTGRIRAEFDEAVDGAPSPIGWRLSFPPIPPGFRYLAPAMLARFVAPSNACTPFESVRYDGELTLRGPAANPFVRTRRLSGAPGMLGHIWGTRHADGWVWLHANRFEDEGGRPVEGVLEAVTLEKGPSRLTTLFASFGGTVWESNGPLALLCHNRGSMVDGEYRLESSIGALRLSGSARVPHGRDQRFVLDDTDGSRLENLNSSVADFELRVAGAPGLPPSTLFCRGAAALERVRRLA